MSEHIENDLEELPLQTFLEVYDNVKAKLSNKYSFVVKGGNDLKTAILNLFQVIWKTEDFPSAWQVSTLTQLFKGGEINSLDCFRFIHVKDQLSKFFSQMIMFHAKEIITNNMTKFQIACKPGHRASEHL